MIFGRSIVSNSSSKQLQTIGSPPKYPIDSEKGIPSQSIEYFSLVYSLHFFEEKLRAALFEGIEPSNSNTFPRTLHSNASFESPKNSASPSKETSLVHCHSLSLPIIT